MVSQFGSLGYTIMGKTADLTVVQKTIMDTLHKEVRTNIHCQRSWCSQSAVSKHVNRKLREGKRGWKRKRCTANRENAALWGLSSKINQELGELHKEWTEAVGSRHREPPHTSHRLKEFGTVVIRGVLPGLRRRRTGLCPVVQSPLVRWEQVSVFHLETRA